MAERGRVVEETFRVVRDPDLSPEEKALWVLYRSYDFRGEGSWPSDETLAGHLGKGARSVQRYRQTLMAKGFLLQKLRGPNPAAYQAVCPVEHSPPMANQEPPSLAMAGEAFSTESPAASPGMAKQSLARDGETTPIEPQASPEASPSVTQSFATGGEQNTERNTVKEEKHSEPNGSGDGAPGLFVENGMEGGGEPTGHLLGVLRETGWRGGLERDAESRDASLLVAWLREGRRPEVIESVIRGFHALVEDGRIAWIPPGSPWTLRALQNTRTVDGQEVRSAYAVAQDHRLRQTPPTPPSLSPRGTGLTPLGTILRTAMGV